MNKNLQETIYLVEDIASKLADTSAEVMVAPTFVNLSAAVSALESSKIEVVAQNMHFAESGAYTGEISAGMLKAIGIQSVIIGHSERRAYFGETDELLSKKVKAALENNLRVIFCFPIIMLNIG